LVFLLLDLATVWLKDENGYKAFFPDTNNAHFHLTSDVGLLISNLIVEGNPIQEVGTASSQSLGVFPQQNNSCRGSVKRLSLDQSPACNVKVLQAKMKKSTSGRPEFKINQQTFIEINETTANVEFLKAFIRAKWGNEQTLVTSDGLEINDCPGTRGKIVCYLIVILIFFI
jgi:hypothetical protein